MAHVYAIPLPGFYMKHLAQVIFLVLLSALASAPAHGQETRRVTTEASPTGGLDRLALTYYKINFTPEQRKLLEDKTIEFIFMVDAQGVPTLEKINNVQDSAILDSLRQASTRIPKFAPKKVNGVAESSLYFFQMRFPAYPTVAGRPGYPFQQPRTLSPEEADQAYNSGARLDIVFGGMANTYFGRAQSYLHPGGGMKLEVMMKGKGSFGAGLMMNFYGNKSKKDYPIASTREQNSAPPTLLIGLGANKSLLQEKRNHFIIQFELNLAFHNVTNRQDQDDEDYTQFVGVSPGLVGHYLIPFGKIKANYAYGYSIPTLYRNHIDLHAGIRPLFYGKREATGIMADLGLSYRLGSHFLEPRMIY